MNIAYTIQINKFKWYHFLSFGVIISIKVLLFTHDVSLSEPFHASCMPYTLDCNPTFTIFTDWDKPILIVYIKKKEYFANYPYILQLLLWTHM